MFSSGVSLGTGHVVAPNDDNVRYTGRWGYQSEICNFGAVYTSEEVGSRVEFGFTGSRFAFFTYPLDGLGTVDIYLDGRLIASDVALSAWSNDENINITQVLYNQFNEKIAKSLSAVAYVYTDDALTSGDHVVKIVSKSGTLVVDSFAYWD